jgi:type IV pilus assembly protein PilC
VTDLPVTEPAAVAAAPLKTGDTPWYKREFFITRPVKAEEVMNFSRQLASFLRAGIPVLDALAVIGEDSGNKQMSLVLDDLRVQLRGGYGLADALARHPRVFPNYYVAMVHSAELTGRLDDTLEQLAGYLERDLESRRKVKSAMTYPAVILVLAIIAVFVLSIYVLPKFKDLFGELGATLPLSTRMLLSFSTFMGDYWWAVLLGLFALAALGFAVYGGAWGKARRDRVLLNAPGIGSILHYVLVERFCRVLGAMVRAGVPLPDAVAVASDATNNRVYQRRLKVVRDEMIRGEGLARPIAASGLFPAAARQMIRVGESTGTLDEQLSNAADFYARDVEYRLKRFTDLFEPAIIIAVGFMVGFIAIAMVQAMYGVFDQVKV